MARAKPGRSEPAAQSLERARAVAFRVLVGPDIVGAIQVGREYPERHVVSDDELAAHFAGDLAIAIRVGNGKGRSRHLVFDVDARAQERIALIFTEIRRRGFGDATIATDGSSAGRGKVIIFFRSEQQSTALRTLGADILTVSRRASTWGVEGPNDVSLYPQRGEGGLARIGGRNIGRSGPVERLYNAWGEPTDLDDVAPCPTNLRPAREPGSPVKTSPRQAWVNRLIREGITWASVGGTAGINRVVNRLAFETLRTHGDGECGEIEFRRVLEAIAVASPDLHRPSPKNQDQRHPLGWGRRASSAWRHACSHSAEPYTSYSGPLGDKCKGPAVVREVVALLSTIAKRRGLNPLALEVSYRELGSVLGISPVSARERILRAEALGLVVRIDPGVAGFGGRQTGKPCGGAKALFAIVLEGATPESTRLNADRHHAAIQRRAFVASERERRRAAKHAGEPPAGTLVPFRGANAPSLEGSHGTSAGSPLAGCGGEYVPPARSAEPRETPAVDLMVYALAKLAAFSAEPS